jgi:phosphoglycerate dehydrogenase-like enzyme
MYAVNSGVNAVSTAEGALCCIFMLARRANQQQQSFREGRLGRPLGMQLYDKTLGIIGLGAIGTARFTFLLCEQMGGK